MYILSPNTEKQNCGAFVHLSVHPVECFRSLTLGWLIQLFFNLYTILITTKHKLTLKFGCVSSRVMPLYKWNDCWFFCFYSLSLVCLKDIFYPIWKFNVLNMTNMKTCFPMIGKLFIAYIILYFFSIFQ